MSGVFDRLLTILILAGIGYIIYSKMLGKDKKVFGNMVSSNYNDNQDYFGGIKK